jgi:hypothetical protein
MPTKFINPEQDLIVATLEEFLRTAKEGKLTSLVIAGHLPNGDIAHAEINEDINVRRELIDELQRENFFQWLLYRLGEEGII